jgi:hypothetical protein
MVTPTLSSEFGPVAADFQISPWWTASLPFKHDGGLVQKLKMAEANGVSEREWGRLTSAVKEDWNSLAFLLEIESAEPVYGGSVVLRGSGARVPGQARAVLLLKRRAKAICPVAARNLIFQTCPTAQ